MTRLTMRTWCAARSKTVCVAILLSACNAMRAHGQLPDNVWIGPAGGAGSYNDAGNWSLGHVPDVTLDRQAVIRFGSVNVDPGTLPQGPTISFQTDPLNPQPVTMNFNPGSHLDLGLIGPTDVRGDFDPGRGAAGTTVNFYDNSYLHAWFLPWGVSGDPSPNHRMNVYGSAHIFINDGNDRGGFIFPSHLYIEGDEAILDAGRSGQGYMEFTSFPGEFTIGLDGPTFSQMVTTGYSQPYATLNVKLLNGYVPSLGQTWDLMQTGQGNYGPANGHFPAANVVNPAGLNPFGAFFTLLTPTASTNGPEPQLMKLAFLDTRTIADFNADTHVNLLDWEVMKSHMFTSTTTGDPSEGDMTLDGKIDRFDFRLWKKTYLALGGSAEALAAATEAVPEPTTALLVFAAAAGWLAAGRRIKTAQADVTWTGAAGDSDLSTT